MEREGLIPGFQLAHHRVKLLKGQDGHNGSEDLLAHDRTVIGYAIYHRRRDSAGTALRLFFVINFGAG